MIIVPYKIKIIESLITQDFLLHTREFNNLNATWKLYKYVVLTERLLSM